MKNLLPPPWIKFPQIDPFSIGWRMGCGEDYKFKFNEWFKTLSQDEQRQYQQLFTEPATWRGYWDERLGGDESTLFVNGDFVTDLWEREPRYKLKWLKKRYNAGKADKFLLFWGHQKSANLSASCLSQWYSSSFWEDETKYICAEQYMMAKKAQCFGDKEALGQILSAKDPAQMKALGRQVRGFDAKVWDEVKFCVVLNASYLKFSQNAPLRDFLLQTGSKILVEASPVDKIWGIGLGASDENAQNPMKWRGQNLLGFALMRARDEIAKVYKNVHLCDENELNLDHL